MCIRNLVLIGLFVFKILSKNSILTLIKGRNSVANLPKFELIQAFMHVLVTCKHEEDQINYEGARLLSTFRSGQFLTRYRLYGCPPYLQKMKKIWSKITERKVQFTNPLKPAPKIWNRRGLHCFAYIYIWFV